jgi:K(+)-stimulated pyrophosphate-energized sodium pump
MSAVGRAASKVVVEVRRQFKDIAGLMEATAKPDYARCVDIVTASALSEMRLPAILAISTPIIVGLLLGINSVGGLLIGATGSGFVLAVMMANSGGAWDNAKKYIEEGKYGGKGSPAHKAGVVGDTVGDPFKDTSGPSINILIKLMSMVSIVFAAFVLQNTLIY